MDSEDEEEKEISKGSKHPITMYISEGNKYLRLLKYNKAIEFFDTALEWEPTNERSLIGRSKCNMRLAKYTEAKEDAEVALKLNPKSYEAKLLIGEAEYFMGDFEKAFLTFYRGHRIRLNCEEFKLGHQICRKAIDNALQPDEPVLLDDQDIGNIEKLKPRKDSKQSGKVKTPRDSFSCDVDFINELLNDDSVECIHPDCEYLLAYLKERQQFWQTQNPGTSQRNLTEPPKFAGSEVKHGEVNCHKQSPEKLSKSVNRENRESKIADCEKLHKPSTPQQVERSENNGEKSVSADNEEETLS